MLRFESSVIIKSQKKIRYVKLKDGISQTG